MQRTRRRRSADTLRNCIGALILVLPIWSAYAQPRFDPCAPETPEEAAKLNTMRDGWIVRSQRKQHCADQQKQGAERQAADDRRAAQEEGDRLQAAKRAQQEHADQERVAERRKEFEKEEAEATAQLGGEATGNAFVDWLLVHYRDRLTFASHRAFEIVDGFNIDCKMPDHRQLPLLNYLLAAVRSIENRSDLKGARMTYDVDNRGDDVRISYTLQAANGRIIGPTLNMELNQWGELTPIDIKVDAIYWACGGGLGPITEKP